MKIHCLARDYLLRPWLILLLPTLSSSLSESSSEIGIPRAARVASSRMTSDMCKEAEAGDELVVALALVRAVVHHLGGMTASFETFKDSSV